MMRLIDAESTKKLAQEHLIDPYHVVSACAVIDKAETVDAVPVVRCRECIHYKPQSKSARWNCTTLFCNRTATIKMDPDDFCSRGERSTDNLTEK